MENQRRWNDTEAGSHTPYVVDVQQRPTVAKAAAIKLFHRRWPAVAALFSQNLCSSIRQSRPFIPGSGYFQNPGHFTSLVRQRISARSIKTRLNPALSFRHRVAFVLLLAGIFSAALWPDAPRAQITELRLDAVSEPVQTAVTETQQSYQFSLTISDPSGTALPAELSFQFPSMIGGIVTSFTATTEPDSAPIASRRQFQISVHFLPAAVAELISRLEWQLTADLIENYRLSADNLPLLDFDLFEYTRMRFCRIMAMEDGDCQLITGIENNEFPWQITEEGTFSGPGLQCDPDLPHESASVLSLTLSSGVAALEFYRRVSSEGRWDWLTFEYNNFRRGSTGRDSASTYQMLPFFGAEGTRTHGDISGTPSIYYFGNRANPGAEVRFGPNGEYSLLRLLPDTPASLTELRWIFHKDLNSSEGQDRGWIDSLQLHPALTNLTQLCSALDLNARNCPLSALTIQPTDLLWTVDDGVELMATGGSALRVPFRVGSDTTTCLTVTTRLHRAPLHFDWRLGSLTGSQLSFRVNGTEIETLTSIGSSTTWQKVIHNLEGPSSTLAWCYSHPPASDGISEGWIDRLFIDNAALPKARTRISAVSTPTILQSTTAGTEFRFVAVLDDSTDPLLFTVIPEPQLTTTTPTELTNWSYTVVTTYTGSDNARQFIYTFNALLDIPLFLETSELGITFTLTIAVNEVGTVQLPTAEAHRLRLCSVLDLSNDSCELIRSFAQQHSGSGTEELSWAVTEAESVAGGSALHSPLKVPENTESCLVLTPKVALPVNTELRFQWQVDSAQDTDFMRFSIDSTVISSISGPLASNPWSGVSHTLTQAAEQLSWCFDDTGPASTGDSTGWIDSLQLLLYLPQFTIVEITTITAQQTLGRYHFTVAARNNNDLIDANAAREQLLLTPPQAENIAAYTITSTLSANGDKLFMVAVQLQTIDTTGRLTVALAHDDPALLAPENISRRITFAALNANRSICEPLDLSARECALISDFATTPDFPWQIAETDPQSGDNLLASATDVADSQRSCLTLELAAAGETVYSLSFSWRLDAADGKNLSFRVDGSEMAALSGDGSDSGWQFFAHTGTAAIDSFSWCYSVDTGSADIPGQAWLDNLNIGSTIGIQSISTPVLVQREEHRLTYSFTLTLVNNDGPALEAEHYVLSLEIIEPSADHMIIDSSFSEEQRAEATGLVVTATVVVELVELVSTISWNRLVVSGQTDDPGDPPPFSLVTPPLALSVPMKSVLCEVMELSSADCSLITGVEHSNFPWQITLVNSFSGPSLQSNPNLPDDDSSVLSFTLAPGVAALEFYRRISSQVRQDWLTFEYNNYQRGGSLTLPSLAYLALPFFNSEGIPSEGSLSGAPGNYAFGSYRLPNFPNPNTEARFGPKRKYLVLRVLPDTPISLTELRWIYHKDRNTSSGKDRGWIDRLQLYPALTTSDQFCSVLDLNERNCLFTALTIQPTELQWTIDDEAGLMATGGSALRVPFRVDSEQTSACLTVTTRLGPISLQFRWRPGSLTGSQLSFEVNGTEVETLTSTGSSTTWYEVIHNAEDPISTLAWCYTQPSDSDIISEGWIDSLQLLLLEPQFAIAAVTAITAQQQLGQYQFTVATQDNNEGFNPAAANELLLAISEANNITTYTVTSALSANGYKLFMFTVQLQAVDTIGSFTVELSHPDPTLLAAVGTTRNITIAALTAEQSICIPLDMSPDDCALISGFSTTAEYPWQITEASLFQSGVNLLASHPYPPDDEQSCLTLELSPAASDVRRIDFTWAVDSGPGDELQLSLNDQNAEPLAFNSGPLRFAAPRERQQRLLTTTPTSLSWCYRKDSTGSGSEDRGWLDSLSFHSAPAALLPANRASLCEALDLESDSCDLIQSFAQQHTGRGSEGLTWAVTTSVASAMGGSALRSPLTVPETAESCLSLQLTAALKAGTELRFQWRVDSATDTDFLRFRVGATVLESISGDLASNPWSAARHTLAQASDELAWCFDDTDAASAGDSLGWIDQLQILQPQTQFAIAAVTTITAQQQLGGYAFTVVARNNNQFFDAAAELELLLLTTSKTNNIAAYTVTNALSDNGEKLFMFVVQLQTVDTIGSFTVALGHADPTLLAAENTTRSITFAALTAEQSICMPLGLSTEDCDLIDGFATTPEYPWQIVEAESGNGDERLASAATVADDSASCLTLTLTDNALAAGSRIDFSWAVDSATGDSLQFAINDVDTAGIDGAAIPEHRQQRFSNNAISSLSWCYSKDAAGSAGQDRGWLDSLSLHPPAEAPLLADQQTLCTALDLSTADCAALSTYTQSPDSLSWSITDDIALQGDNAMQSPATVTTGESSCLRLQTDLPADTAINFAWRVDSADSSELGFEVNGSPVEAIRMQGTVPDMVGNGWQLQRYTHTTALSSLGWCFRRGAMFAGAERGWLDQLRLEPAFSYPLITLETAPTRADNDSPWVFDIRIDVAAGQTALPEGLQLITALESNLSTLSITVQPENGQTLEVRVETVVEDDSNTALIRFGFSGLPTAVEPLSDGLTVVIEPQELTQVVPVLRALADDGPAENDKVSLGDLLTGFNVISGGDSSALSSNLPRTNSGLTDDISALTTTIDNPQQRPVLDVDSNGTVDALDFRLMMRYYAGLRGPALCDEVCRIKLESLLEE